MALARPTPLDTLLFLVSLPTSARHGSSRVLVLVQPHLCKFIWEVMLVSSVARALGDEASDTAAAPTVVLSFSQVLHVGRVSSFPFGCCSPRCDHTHYHFYLHKMGSKFKTGWFANFSPWTHWFLPKLKQTYQPKLRFSDKFSVTLISQARFILNYTKGQNDAKILDWNSGWPRLLPLSFTSGHFTFLDWKTFEHCTLMNFAKHF